MKNRRNYYRLLHVQPDAPREVIRTSYRTIMHKMRTHPDLGGDKAEAALINEAYSTLVDEESRAAYDRLCHSTGWSRSANDPRHVAPPSVRSESVRCSFCACFVIDQCVDRGFASFCPTCDSPLAPVAMVTADESDRRTISRIAKQVDIGFCIRWPQPLPYLGRASDISLTGMCFSTNTPVGDNQRIKIESAELKAVARVVRSQLVGDYWEVGVHFLNLCFTRARGSFVQERI